MPVFGSTLADRENAPMLTIATAADAVSDGKYLERMPLFKGLGTEVIAEICKCVRDLKLCRDQVCLEPIFVH